MTHVINSFAWCLSSSVIVAASLEATKEKLKFVYLSNMSKKDDLDFLFFKDEEQKRPAFVIDIRDL